MTTTLKDVRGPLNADKRQVRLARLVPSSILSEQVSYSVEVISLDDDAIYEGLSYA